MFFISIIIPLNTIISFYFCIKKCTIYNIFLPSSYQHTEENGRSNWVIEGKRGEFEEITFLSISPLPERDNFL